MKEIQNPAKFFEVLFRGVLAGRFGLVSRYKRERIGRETGSEWPSEQATCVACEPRGSVERCSAKAGQRNRTEIPARETVPRNRTLKTSTLLLRYIVVGFLLNFFWEVCHSVTLYAGFEGIGARHVPSLIGYIELMLRVSLVDTCMLCVIALGGIALWKQVAWFFAMDVRKYAYVVLLGFAIAAWIEWRGVFWLHLWSYNAMMPTLFGLGLSPLLQLPVSTLIAMWLIRRDHT